MTLYQFRCDECNYTYDTFYRMSERPDVIEGGCEMCGGTVRNVMHSPGVKYAAGSMWKELSDNEARKQEYEGCKRYGLKDDEISYAGNRWV